MGLQELKVGGARSRYRYQKLENGDDKFSVRPRRRWLKMMNGRVKGFRVFRCRRFKWKAVSVIILPRKMVADIVNLIKMNGRIHLCPMSSHWGLPVLSHFQFCEDSPSLSAITKSSQRKKLDLLSVKLCNKICKRLYKRPFFFFFLACSSVSLSPFVCLPLSLLLVIALSFLTFVFIFTLMAFLQYSVAW